MKLIFSHPRCGSTTLMDFLNSCNEKIAFEPFSKKTFKSFDWNNYSGIKHVTFDKYPFANKDENLKLLESCDPIISLYRENKLKTAISIKISEQLKRWHDFKFENGTYKIDGSNTDKLIAIKPEEVLEIICELEECKHYWRGLVISYEEIYEKKKGLAKVLKHFKINEIPYTAIEQLKFGKINSLESYKLIPNYEDLRKLSSYKNGTLP